MKIVTLYVDGLQQAVDRGLYSWLSTLDADVVALQNLQAKEYQLSEQVLHPADYNAYFFDAEAEQYSGVAILTRDVPKAIMTGLGFEQADFQGRFIQADFDMFSVASINFPSIDEHNTLENKLEFQRQFTKHLEKTQRKRREFIFCGNFAASHQTVDVQDWRNHQSDIGFLPEERAWFDAMFGPMGFVDAFREANFGENQLTYWPTDADKQRQRNGWRMDYQVCTPRLRQSVVDAKVLKTFEHTLRAAVMVEYDLSGE